MVESLCPLGRILEVNPNKRDGLARKVTLRTKYAFLERPMDNIILLEAPRLHESSLTLLILMYLIDCEQSLFCSEIRREERNEESKTSVTLARHASHK